MIDNVRLTEAELIVAFWVELTTFAKIKVRHFQINL